MGERGQDLEPQCQPIFARSVDVSFIIIGRKVKDLGTEANGGQKAGRLRKLSTLNIGSKQ